MRHAFGKRALYGAVLVCFIVGAIEECAGAEAGTPQTRTLTAEEAARALERDWLFQATGGADIPEGVGATCGGARL